jgi:WD40 repeat protein
MDYYIGKLLKALDASGLSNNTMVIFTSDNGGHPEFAYNRPFRGSKWNLYEGGVRIPMIIRWPGTVRAGRKCEIPVMQTDLLPTFMALTGAKAQFEEPIDGVSFLPALYNENLPVNAQRSLIWHFPYYHPELRAYQKAAPKIGKEDGFISQTKPQSSIRRGDYKLIYFYEDDQVELYNLKTDPSESNNLSYIMAAKASELKSALLAGLKEMKARLPRSNTNLQNTSMNNSKEIQLTTGPKGHFLNPFQCFSPDGQWIVYDTRNDGTQIGSTASIEMVHAKTGEIKELYRTENQTQYGPGVGAAAFSPVENKAIFIHGIRNSNAVNPYGFARRTGVAIDLAAPGKPIFMDARDVIKPYTPGALRGGTHAHSWSGDGQWLSFTYNDYVLEQLSKTNPKVQDLRTVGVMVPKPVDLKQEHSLENNSGTMFSVVIAEVTENPKPGTDEIDKAFDECWIGTNGYLKIDGIRQKRAIAFQGNVRNKEGITITEVFVADLPEDLTKALPGKPLEGTKNTRPNVPSGISHRRITFSKEGVQGPRHWLQSTPDGSMIAFLSKDPSGNINAFGVSPNGGPVRQLTAHRSDIQSGITISPDGRYLAYVINNAIFITDLTTQQTHQLTKSATEEECPVGNVVWSPDGESLAYNRYIKSDSGRYLQIFLLKVVL